MKEKWKSPGFDLHWPSTYQPGLECSWISSWLSNFNHPVGGLVHLLVKGPGVGICSHISKR